MILNIFTVYDAKAEAYLQPFYMQSKGEALRAFMETVADPNHQFSKHSADFSLVHLGEFDNSTARFTPLPTPLVLALAHELKAKTKNEAIGSNVVQLNKGSE